MGHTQFMPTSLDAHGIDLRGDGRRDIWSDDPTDALASTAAYRGKRLGHGPTLGVEVVLPEGFDHTLARDTKSSKPRFLAIARGDHGRWRAAA